MEALLLTSHCRLIHNGENLIHSAQCVHCTVGFPCSKKSPVVATGECSCYRGKGKFCRIAVDCSVQCALCTVLCILCRCTVLCALCCERLEQEEATLSPPCLPLPCPVQYNVVAATLSYMYMFMWYTTLSQRGEKSHKSHPIQSGGLSK